VGGGFYIWLARGAMRFASLPPRQLSQWLSLAPRVYEKEASMGRLLRATEFETGPAHLTTEWLSSTM